MDNTIEQGTQHEPTAEELAATAAAMDELMRQDEKPEPPKPETPQSWRKLVNNRFAAMFASVAFHTTASGKTYHNDDGTSQRKIAAGVAVYKGGFAGVPFKVQAKKLGAAKDARIVAAISFVGNRADQAIMPIGEKAKTEFTEFKAALSRDFTVWRKDQGSYKAQAPLGSAALDDAGDLFADDGTGE